MLLLPNAKNISSGAAMVTNGGTLSRWHCQRWLALTNGELSIQKRQMDLDGITLERQFGVRFICQLCVGVPGSKKDGGGSPKTVAIVMEIERIPFI